MHSILFQLIATAHHPQHYMHQPFGCPDGLCTGQDHSWLQSQLALKEAELKEPWELWFFKKQYQDVITVNIFPVAMSFCMLDGSFIGSRYLLDLCACIMFGIFSYVLKLQRTQKHTTNSLETCGAVSGSQNIITFQKHSIRHFLVSYLVIYNFYADAFDLTKQPPVRIPWVNLYQ